ncbi:hypothetical protein Goshw_004869 [Gossypium schwendimanii]|uniref:Late embryogenesis abundant protein LEA-2 subgroup domain-containing protein n=1 Tax=Gossypium schwendimanii TaxID=34291 RepID=A0A7J9M0Y7_GOSSC|nr:hypothetical protein [Gossypium schwendimanii]
MALSKLEQQSPTQEPPSPSHCYTALPPQAPDENYVVSPYSSPGGRLRWCGCRMLYTGTASFFLLATLVYICWPSDPDVKIVRMHVNRMKIHTVPIIALDMSLLITLKVRNSDVYSMDITSLDVAVRYRGKMLGHVTSEQGHVKALGSSYVEAVLQLNGVEVLSDVVYLLEDLAKGTVPFDTVTEVAGSLGLSFFKFPLKAKLLCEIVVHRTTQTIVRQNCYPQVVIPMDGIVTVAKDDKRRKRGGDYKNRRRARGGLGSGGWDLICGWWVSSTTIVNLKTKLKKLTVRLINASDTMEEI